MIDLQMFLIIGRNQLNAFLLENGIILTETDPEYAVTLLVANILAYFVILIFAYAVKITIKALFKKRSGDFIW